MCRRPHQRARLFLTSRPRQCQLQSDASSSSETCFSHRRIRYQHTFVRVLRFGEHTDEWDYVQCAP